MHKVDATEDGYITIQELDGDKRVGELINTRLENVEIARDITDDTEEGNDGVEPINPEESPNPTDVVTTDEEYKAENKNWLLAAYTQGRGTLAKIFDKALSNFLSDPKTNLDKARMQFNIDFNFENEVWNQVPKKVQLELQKKDLTLDEIKKLLATKIADGRLVSDVIPIKIDLFTSKSSKISKSKNLYVYEGKPDYAEDRKFRYEALTNLLLGSKVYVNKVFKGSTGIFNNTLSEENILTRLGITNEANLLRYIQ